MRKLIVIGTVHNMLPKHKNELQSILKKINSDQILVEIDREINLHSNQIKKFPKEMIFAYKWGIKNNKQVDVFDTNKYGNQIKKSVTKKELKRAEKDFLTIFKRYDWKMMNHPNPKDEEKYKKIESQFIDYKRLKARRKVMLSNIRKLALKEGKILILTGAGHLDFFEKHLKKAIFPFR